MNNNIMVLTLCTMALQHGVGSMDYCIYCALRSLRYLDIFYLSHSKWSTVTIEFRAIEGQHMQIGPNLSFNKTDKDSFSYSITWKWVSLYSIIKLFSLKWRNYRIRIHVLADPKLGEKQQSATPRSWPSAKNFLIFPL